MNMILLPVTPYSRYILPHSHDIPFPSSQLDILPQQIWMRNFIHTWPAEAAAVDNDVKYEVTKNLKEAFSKPKTFSFGFGQKEKEEEGEEGVKEVETADTLFRLGKSSIVVFNPVNSSSLV